MKSIIKLGIGFSCFVLSVSAYSIDCAETVTNIDCLVNEACSINYTYNGSPKTLTVSSKANTSVCNDFNTSVTATSKAASGTVSCKTSENTSLSMTVWTTATGPTTAPITPTPTLQVVCE